MCLVMSINLVEVTRSGDGGISGCVGVVEPEAPEGHHKHDGQDWVVHQSEPGGAASLDYLLSPTSCIFPGAFSSTPCVVLLCKEQYRFI